MRRLRVIAVVQARMGSTRLPGKVLADIAGRPMLDWVLTRVGRASPVGEVVVATTTMAEDDVLCDHAQALGVPVVRGHATDVLSRYVSALRATDADVVVRVTADCPFIDPGLTGTVVETLLDAGDRLDYVSNVIEPRTFPRGLDVEVITRDALLEADRLDTDPRTREHVTPFVRESRRFRVEPVANDTDLSSVRWTVDTAANLTVVRHMAEHFAGADTMPWRELLAAWEEHPQWRDLNAHIEQKAVRRTSS